jgi:Uma2 family endonuclease
MATVTKARITAEEFMNMDLGDGLFELVRGEIVKVPPAEFWHGFICGNIGAILRDFGRRTGHGHVATNDSAVIINPDTVRGADVCYYSEARWPRAQVGQGPPPVPPDLVVEVYSPSNRPGEMLEKVSEYLRAGVPMVWTVHPERRNLTIYRGDDPTPLVLTETDVVENLPELPGFHCRVAEFFA